MHIRNIRTRLSGFMKNTLNIRIEPEASAEKARNIPIKQIIHIPEFQNLMHMDDSVLAAMTESMKTDGFKDGHEIHLWSHDGQMILIDGETRTRAWTSLGHDTIPAIIHDFATLEEAKKFALGEQLNRRNLSGDALLKAVASMDYIKGKGKQDDGPSGKTSEILAKKLGVSAKTVEKARTVMKDATPEQKKAITEGKASVNQVYQELKGTKVKKQPELSIRFVRFILNNYVENTLENYDEAITEAWRDNQNNIDDMGQIIDDTKAVLGPFTRFMPYSIN